MASKSIQKGEIGGIAVVTIPVRDYEKLLIKSQQLEIQQLRLKHFTPGRSSIDRNPEVASYLADNLGLVPLKELLNCCTLRFGSDLTPSRSAAYRYWARLRKISVI